MGLHNEVFKYIKNDISFEMTTKKLEFISSDINFSILLYDKFFMYGQYVAISLAATNLYRLDSARNSAIRRPDDSQHILHLCVRRLSS